MSHHEPPIKEEEMEDTTVYPTPSSSAAAAASTAGMSAHTVAMAAGLHHHHAQAAAAAHAAAVSAVVAAGGVVAPGSALAPHPVEDESEVGDPVRRAWTLHELQEEGQPLNYEYRVLINMVGRHGLQSLVPHEHDPVGAWDRGVGCWH